MHETSNVLRCSGRFSGAMAALVTPLNDAGAIDEPAAARLVRHVLDGGVSGICPVGSTGEGPHLAATARVQMARIVRTAVGPELPVIPGVTCVAFDDARRQTEQYAEAGATAVLAAPPYYYPLPQSAVQDFFARLADVSPLPLLLYNIPQFTKVPISVESVAVLSKHSNIAGMKDSSRDFEFFEATAAIAPPGFSLLTGADTMLLASLLMGGDGTIAASVNLVPSWSVALIGAYRSGDLDKARGIQFRLLQLVQACRVGNPPAAWKGALELVGLCSSRTAAPTPQLTAEQKSVLRAQLDEVGLTMSATQS